MTSVLSSSAPLSQTTILLPTPCRRSQEKVCRWYVYPAGMSRNDYTQARP